MNLPNIHNSLNKLKEKMRYTSNKPKITAKQPYITLMASQLIMPL